MKKDKKKSGSRRRSLLATGIASLAILATVATATYAWFSINTTVTVGVSSLEAVAGDNIDISSDGTTWGSTVSLTLDELNSTVTDISGDGQTFYNKAGIETTEYVEFKLQFRASSYYAIYLNTNSRVLPHAEKILGADSGNKSTYGDYSKDNIAGAVRVAFLFKDEGAEKEEVKLVWAPNSEYALSKTGDTYAMSYNGNPATYPYRNSSATTAEGIGLFYPNDPGFLATKSDAWQTNTEVGLYDKKNALATIIPSSPGVMKEVEITIRIWLEGEDPECANPFLGGIFDTTLSFSAQALSQSTAPNVSVVPVNNAQGVIGSYKLDISNAEGKEYEFSTDGTNYTDYTNLSELVDDEGKGIVNRDIYVRETAQSTGTGIPSAAKRVSIGKYGQVAPNDRTFTAEPNTRVLSASSYANNTNGASLEYSTDGTRYNPYIQDLTVSSLAKRTYYIRYAAVGNYDASAPVTVTMIGKETAPVYTAVSLPGEGQALVTITNGLEYAMSKTQFTQMPTETDTSNGEQMAISVTPTDGIVYLALRRLSSNTEESVHSDWAYFSLNITTGTVTAVSAPSA